MNANDYPMTLFYDGQCPICRTEMRQLRARDTAGRLRFADVRADAFEGLEGIPIQALLDAIHARTGDGRIVIGTETLRLAYRAVGLGWLVAFTAWPLLRGPSELAYRWFARHRFSMPAWLGLTAFALRPRGVPCDDDTCALREPRR